MSTFRSLALTFALLGSAGASTLTYPATTVTLHERAADWQSAELSGLVRQGDAVTVPEGIGSGTLTQTLAQIEAELQKHPAAYPELVVTSSEKGRGIATLRAIIDGLC